MSIFRYKNEQDEWVELPFLRGPQGPSGVDGKDGTNGTDGRGIAKTEIDAEGRLVVTYTDGTSETLSNVVGADGKDGDNGTDGKDGANGKDGADGIGISTTTINENGELIITYTTGESSTLGKVVGTDGKDGAQGPQGEPGVNGSPGVNGTNGITPHIGDNGNWFIGDTDTGLPSRGIRGEQGPQGETGETGPQGEPGVDGTDGYTPQYGVDYWTESDKEEMVQLVLAALPSAEEVSF